MAADKKKINLPESELPAEPLTRSNLRITDEKAAYNFDEEVRDIDSEFRRGFDFVKHLPRSVTVYGSARAAEGSPAYDLAREVARRIVEEFAYAVVTGGGPGIMEAANRGALDAGGQSYGVGIELPEEQAINPFVNASEHFYFFFARRFILSLAAEAYLFFPGGFGTLDEFFEIITLVQTRKIQAIPVILIGSDFWKPLEKYMHETLYEKSRTISHSDLKLYQITDDVEEILQLVGRAESRH
jgi:uncharacterized protein (TIGR00730 family)